MLPEAIHADLWRGNKLARARSRVVERGDADLARELPGGGWPRGALTDLSCGRLVAESSACFDPPSSSLPRLQKFARKRAGGDHWHAAHFWDRPGAAGRGVYPLCMPEVSSVTAQ
jgi:hypothetical protein